MAAAVEPLQKGAFDDWHLRNCQQKIASGQSGIKTGAGFRRATAQEETLAMFGYPDKVISRARGFCHFNRFFDFSDDVGNRCKL